MARLTLRVPKPLARFIAQKGSVALDGVSLTVNDVDGRHVLGADHPAHAERHDLRRAESRRRAQPRSRPDGALRSAPDGDTLDGTGAQADAAPKETGVKGARILVVEARFYDDIADMLLRGAKRVLKDAGAAFDRRHGAGRAGNPRRHHDRACMRATAREQPYDGVVALGCVIRGETSHYDIVAGESARAIMDISIALDMPIGNGILTVDTDAQARARARPTGEDKGGGAARAALTLVRLKRRLVREARR